MSRYSSPWLLVLVLPGSAVANPCVLEYVGGRTPLATPPQRDIFIAQETITFDLRGKRTPSDEHLRGKVRITYAFENRGPATTVLMGFPIGRYTDGFYPARDIVSRFRVHGAGAGPLLPKTAAAAIPLDRVGIRRCEGMNAGPTLPGKEGAGYAWYLWRQTFEPGRNRLEVSYHLELLSDWQADSSVVIDYVLTTTAGWGQGRIGRLAIDFRVRGVPRAWKIAHGIPEASRPRPGQHLRFTADDFLPHEDLRFEHLWPGAEDDVPEPVTQKPHAKPRGLKWSAKPRFPRAGAASP